ncbi:response regulator transcription factor [Shouchella lonarensis]|uniref:Two-component system, OmpR family, response regulator CssR n=1 Tax=Shouchella lonarensis TaxID=1464122 RepID=A0A1G6JVA9_9BACI|nr:response regulator transcription factor [Shouchella lonarensis]SDC22682.1 two-component system, OmpR family, response regulator CssR [Shouchella lonarensis]
MEQYQIYLVEDEENLAEVLKTYLQKEGWQVTVFTNGHDAMQAVNDEPHLWVLDIMLPGRDGYQVLKAIKQRADTPVIFISARDQDLDRVLGLEMGSDDYLAKPFLPQELIIRAKKLLNRVYGTSVLEVNNMLLSGYNIDPVSRVIVDKENEDEVIEMTTKEMDVTLLLISEIGKAFSREFILKKVWDRKYIGSARAVDDVVRRVRKKMPRLHVETLYGYGYRVLRS